MWTWLVIFAAGLVFLKIFAPLPDPWDGISTLVLAASLLTYSCIILWEERQKRKADQSA